MIVIDNSDIAKPAIWKLKTLAEIRDVSAEEITQVSYHWNGNTVRKREDAAPSL